MTLGRYGYICGAVAALLLTACGGSDVAERISTAEMAYATEDAAAARRICDDIVDDNASDSTLTAMQYGRLSILYMQLYDRTDDSDALDMATQCYRSSYKVNADSAAWFYSHLPVEQDKYGMSLTMLVQSMDNPADISDFHGSPSADDTDSDAMTDSDSHNHD